MVKFFVKVDECEVIPRGYGVCWYDAYYCRKVCCPVPLNWLLPKLSRFYWRIVAGPYPRTWVLSTKEAHMVRESRLSEGHKRGGNG